MRKAKTIPVFLSVILLLLFMGMSSLYNPALAQGGDTSKNDFSVSVDITGVIQSITNTTLTLEDGSTIAINNDTKGVSSDLQPGVTVTVTAELGDEIPVALSIAIGTGSGDSSPDLSADASATPTMTATPTENSNGGKNGKGV